MPTIKEAFYLAKSGRPGPVLVDITKDAQQATTDWTWNDAPVKLRGYQGHRVPAKSDMTKAIELIKAARKPLILAGQGVIQSNAMKELRAFAETIDAPVAVTLLGIGGFAANHPLSIGMMGMHGEAWVNHAIQEADLLIALGMRFDDRVTGRLETYAVHARKIHVDIDRSEIGKIVKVDVG